MKKNSFKQKLEALLDFADDQERVEQEADFMAMQFLSRIDKEMARRGITKKELAQKVGTSPAFITQLFRGDRKPNWSMLAKMKFALDIDFVVCTKLEQEELLQKEINDYHRRLGATPLAWWFKSSP
jgi:Predicted transcription factor, homolog of eukaryotic MBF1